MGFSCKKDSYKEIEVAGFFGIKRKKRVGLDQADNVPLQLGIVDMCNSCEPKPTVIKYHLHWGDFNIDNRSHFRLEFNLGDISEFQAYSELKKISEAYEQFLKKLDVELIEVIVCITD